MAPLHEAAGRVSGAAGLIVTHDFLLQISAGQSGNFGEQGQRRREASRVIAGFVLQVTNRSMRTAVDVVVTTNSLKDKTHYTSGGHLRNLLILS